MPLAVSWDMGTVKKVVETSFETFCILLGITLSSALLVLTTYR